MIMGILHNQAKSVSLQFYDMSEVHYILFHFETACYYFKLRWTYLKGTLILNSTNNSSSIPELVRALKHIYAFKNHYLKHSVAYLILNAVTVNNLSWEA